MNKGDWVAEDWKDTQMGSNPQFGRIKEVWSEPYPAEGMDKVPTVLANIVLYDWDGTKVGRRSEPMGGPTTFEPAFEMDGWVLIEEPKFPLTQYGYSNKLRRIEAVNDADLAVNNVKAEGDTLWRR